VGPDAFPRPWSHSGPVGAEFGQGRSRDRGVLIGRAACDAETTGVHAVEHQRDAALDAGEQAAGAVLQSVTDSGGIAALAFRVEDAVIALRRLVSTLCGGAPSARPAATRTRLGSITVTTALTPAASASRRPIATARAAVS
jgi:hypothetical protein